MEAWDRLLNRIERTNAERMKKHNALREEYFQAIGDSVSADLIAKIRGVSVPYTSCAILIADEGREGEITRLKRKHSVYNPVPSHFGRWHGGFGTAKNIPLTTFIEDAVFKDSAHSYFIQLVDCVAFALLKEREPYSPRVLKYKLHQAFESCVGPICYKQAAKNDPLGVVRN